MYGWTSLTVLRATPFLLRAHLVRDRPGGGTRHNHGLAIVLKAQIHVLGAVAAQPKILNFSRSGVMWCRNESPSAKIEKLGPAAWIGTMRYHNSPLTLGLKKLYRVRCDFPVI